MTERKVYNVAASYPYIMLPDLRRATKDLEGKIRALAAATGEDVRFHQLAPGETSEDTRRKQGLFIECAPDFAAKVKKIELRNRIRNEPCVAIAEETLKTVPLPPAPRRAAKFSKGFG